MSLTDYKITDGDVSNNGVSAAPDKLTGTASENKALFDRLIAQVVKAKLNDLIDELADELALKMPLPADMGAEGEYMQSDGQGGVRWDSPTGSGDMLRSVYDTDTDGRVDAADEALECSGNAATASKLESAIKLYIQDKNGDHRGSGVDFDGSASVTLKLPANVTANLTGDVTGNVTGNLTGNAATAAKLQTTRTFLVKNGNGNKGASVNFNGGGNVELPLPTTLNVTLGTTKLNANSYGDSLPSSGSEGQLFFLKKVNG